MPSDVVDLRDFYRSGLGQVARRMIRRAIQRVWPDLHGMRLLGIGYTTPFLTALSGDTERTVALMPASLGVLRWPPDGRNLVTLADEGADDHALVAGLGAHRQALVPDLRRRPVGRGDQADLCQTRGHPRAAPPSRLYAGRPRVVALC